MTLSGGPWCNLHDRPLRLHQVSVPFNETDWSWLHDVMADAHKQDRITIKPQVILREAVHQLSRADGWRFEMRFLDDASSRLGQAQSRVQRRLTKPGRPVLSIYVCRGLPTWLSLPRRFCSLTNPPSGDLMKPAVIGENALHPASSIATTSRRLPPGMSSQTGLFSGSVPPARNPGNAPALSPRPRIVPSRRLRTVVVAFGPPKQSSRPTCT